MKNNMLMLRNGNEWWCLFLDSLRFIRSYITETQWALVWGYRDDPSMENEYYFYFDDADTLEEVTKAFEEQFR